jgi:uncharacterized protein YecE (DUF72 family)
VVLRRAEARIGCSGWQYAHWRGAFYPPELPRSRWLAYYCAQFNTVEINNTFYRLPEVSTFARWRHDVPTGFLYAVKASRFLTHMKRLKDPDDALLRFFVRARRLGRALGPVLYQLPPRWKIDIHRLTTFLQCLPRGRRHAIEFREPSWYTDEVFTLLAQHRVALCLHDMQGSSTARLAVGPFIYVRFHGPEKYSGRYGEGVLNDWGRWLASQLREGRSVFAYFNNDAAANAPRDAMRLRTAISRHRHP